MKNLLLVLAAVLVMSLASSAQAATHSVTLNWTPSTAACVTTTNIHKATTPGGEIPIGQPNSNFAAIPTATKTFTDNTVVGGQTNYWTVSAWGPTCGGGVAGSQDSVMSNEIKTVVPADVVPPPPAPTGLTAVVQ